jgi:hypothetical protein
MAYYLLKQNRLVKGARAIRDLPEDMDGVDWIQGKVMPPPPTPLRLVLSENSGGFRGDIIQSLVTLFSEKLKGALDSFGVDNVEFFPVELEDPATQTTENGYHLANIIGLVSCVDMAKSDVRELPSGTGVRLKAFVIDERRAPDQAIFRLDEKPTLIVINERLKTHLETAGLKGLKMIPTTEYDGF